MEVMPNFQFQVCGRKVTTNVREREFSSQMAAKILEHEQAEKFQFQNLIDKKLEASSFDIKRIGPPD